MALVLDNRRMYAFQGRLSRKRRAGDWARDRFELGLGVWSWRLETAPYFSDNCSMVESGTELLFVSLHSMDEYPAAFLSLVSYRPYLTRRCASNIGKASFQAKKASSRRALLIRNPQVALRLQWIPNFFLDPPIV